VRGGRSESNLTLQGKPNTHAWNVQQGVPKQPFAFHSGLWTGPPQATAGPYAHPMCAGRTSVARLQNPYSWLPLQHVFPHVESSNQKNQIHLVVSMSTCRADWLLGLPLTIFRGMWLVLSNAQPPLPHISTLKLLSKQTG
jgi:hypothetical protein